MYLGYCFDEQGFHGPANPLATPSDAYNYCLHWHHEWPEVRITDEYDFCVLHVANHVLKIPWPDGSFKEFDLNASDATARLIAFIKSNDEKL
jgi:hypothetical protein